MKILVFGSNGWIGSQVTPLLLTANHEVVSASCRADDTKCVHDLLVEHEPSHVLCLIGRTHGPGFSTIDYLQQPDKLVENVRDNLFAPVSLALLCKEKNIHFTYLGTGCIFNSLYPEEDTYDEDDEPNFFGSNYSIVKGFTDRLMHLLNTTVLNVRIRMPITNIDHTRNFITKITSYEKVCSVSNSMTVLPTLLPYFVKLMEMKQVGTINLTNPGVISHNEILQMYKDIVDNTFSWENFTIDDQNKTLLSSRSNNQLCTDKLSTIFHDIPNIHIAVKNCLRSWRCKLNNHTCVLVTGGCGAIGSEVINFFKKKYNDTLFVNVDALTYCANIESIEIPHENYVLRVGDICDKKFIMTVLKTYNPTMIIHLAAETHVDQSFLHPIKFIQTNVVGTHNLLECAREYGKIQMFLHMSTDEVYGPVDDDTICDEQAILNPSNPYSASKASAEMICKSYFLSFKLPIIITRCNNAISKYQFPEKLIPKCIECINKNTMIPVHGHGKNKRTFIHGYDIARALCTISRKGVVGETYNIGTTMEYTVLDVVQEVVTIMRPIDNDIASWVKFVPDRDFQDYRYNIDCTKLENLGWKPLITFKDALQDVVQNQLASHSPRVCRS